MTMASGYYLINLRDALDTTALAIDFLADSFKMVLVEDAYTPNFATHDFYADITNEVTGTGYTATGNVIGTVTFAISTDLIFDISTDETWTSATISSIEGRVIHDDTLASDPLMNATDFGATFSVTAGTLTVQEHANGIVRFDGTP